MAAKPEQQQQMTETRAAEILARVRQMAAEMGLTAAGQRSTTMMSRSKQAAPERNEYWRALRAEMPLRHAQDDGGAATDCDVCGGAGVISYDVPPGDPRFGKSFPCPAPNCPARQEREAQRLLRLFESSGLSGEQERFRLTDPFFQAPRFRTALDGVQRLLAKRRVTASEPGHERHVYYGLYLYGAYGVGKSALAAAAVTAFLEVGVAAHFEEVKRLLDWLRDGFHTDEAAGDFEQRLQALRTVPVLVLDDLGAHQATAWSIAQIEDVIDYRYVNRASGLVTLITSNRMMQEIAEDLAAINDGAGWRILSRMRGMLFPVEIAGPDARVAGCRAEDGERHG